MEYLLVLNNLLFVSGFIIGLGAVTVIDFLGFLGQNSKYWSLTTIRAHKVTKPLIWIGTSLLLVSEFLAYYRGDISVYLSYFSYLLVPLVLNGIFLSFYVSPRLLQIEKNKKSDQLLPNNLKQKILISFLISIISWWGSLLLFVLHISL